MVVHTVVDADTVSSLDSVDPELERLWSVVEATSEEVVLEGALLRVTEEEVLAVYRALRQVYDARKRRHWQASLRNAYKAAEARNALPCMAAFRAHYATCSPDVQEAFWRRHEFLR